MKKIYLTLALAATTVFGLNAQNKQSNLTQDQLASPNAALFNNLGSASLKGGNPIVMPTGCDTLGTTWVGGNGQNGNMFDLVNTSTVAIQIVSFAQCMITTGSTPFEIYYKSGSYAGFEQTAGSWTLAGAGSLTAPTASVPALIPVTLTLSIAPSATMAFYVTSTVVANSVAYTNGTNQTGTLSQKNGLEFKEGRGNPYPFGAPFGTAPASRIWNGVIAYCSPLVTGINGIEINETENNVYPNPSANMVNVNVSNVIGMDNASVKIYDMAGRLVYSESNINVNNFAVYHKLNSGLYMLQVENNSKVVLNKKISIQ